MTRSNRARGNYRTRTWDDTTIVARDRDDLVKVLRSKALADKQIEQDAVLFVGPSGLDAFAPIPHKLLGRRFKRQSK